MGMLRHGGGSCNRDEGKKRLATAEVPWQVGGTMPRRNLIIGISLLLALTILIDRAGWSFGAIWPSVAALLLVFSTRSVLGGLFGGAFIGALLLADSRIWQVPMRLVETHLLPNFSSTWKTGAVLFTLLLGGFVHLLERGGILQALLRRLLRGGSARRVETGAGAFGLVCFFDGLANSLMVGRIFQPLADQSGVSRVRLAYIVDTTSAAVACLAFISTWIAYQLSMIREGFLLAGHPELADPYHLFFASLPHNYYAIFALVLMGFAIWKQWDFGPMREYAPTGQDGESRASLDSASDVPDKAPSGSDATQPDSFGLWRAWLPVATLLGIVFFGIYLDGVGRMGQAVWPLAFEKLALAFAEANVPAILILASGVGSAVAWLCFPRSVLKPCETPGGLFIDGMMHLFQPVRILILAWMLSSTLKELGAAAYLGELLGDRLPPGLFPLAVFATASLVAFTTGTSWGTMGLLMPLAIPIAFSLSAGDPASALHLMPMVVGAVFSGAVFGDHCSPISDTTIVSSIASGVDPMDHVRTQLPYALLAAGAAACCGFLPAGLLDWGPWGLVAALTAFLALLFVLRGISIQSPS